MLRWMSFKVQRRVKLVAEMHIASLTQHGDRRLSPLSEKRMASVREHVGKASRSRLNGTGVSTVRRIGCKITAPGSILRFYRVLSCTRVGSSSVTRFRVRLFSSL